MPRRKKGKGSIYKRSDGKWRGQFWLGDDRKSVTGRTKKEVEDKIKILEMEERGRLNNGRNLLYEDFLDSWLETKKNNVSVNTWSYYNQLVRDYIKPSLGMMILKDIKPGYIQKLYNEMSRKGIGARTVEKTHSVIRGSLNTALKYGLIILNPANATDPPRSQKKEMSYLELEEIEKLIKVGRESNDRYYRIYYLAIITGMRQGELLALKWKKIDLEKGIIEVKQSLIRLPRGNLVIEKPKTKSSVRSIKIGEGTIEVLKEQKEIIKEERKVSKLWKENDLVFPSTVGTPIDPTKILKRFRNLLKKAGLPRIRFHDLRHTSASLMLNNGVDILVASRRLGHSKPSVTLDVYGHMLVTAQNEAAEKLEKLLVKN